MSTVPAEVLDAIRQRVDVRALLEAHGHTLKREGAAHKTHCVFHEERTPSMGVFVDRFHCFGCQEHGDAIDLLQRLEQLEWRDAVERLARDAGVAHLLELDVSGPTAAPAAPVKPRPRAPRPARAYPDRDEVLALWQACGRVDEDDVVASWLVARAIDPVRVAQADLARALPCDAPCPAFARPRGPGGAPTPWSATGHRLIAPLSDPFGRIRSLIARDVTGLSGKARKSLSAAGNRRGLVLLDGAARQVLDPSGAGELGTWYEDAPERRLVVVEGEKKFLLHATLASDADEHAPATIGIIGGSEPVLARVPDGWRVYLATDPDAAGAGYAARILALLAARWRLGDLALELRPEHRLDVDEDGTLSVELDHPPKERACA